MTLVGITLILMTSYQQPLIGQPPMQSLDIEGIKRSIPAARQKATVLYFVSVDCPISNRLSPEMSRIATTYARKQVAFYYVYPDRGSDAAQVAKHKKEFGLDGPAFLDHERTLVKLCSAKVVPQAAIFDAHGLLVYSGRINNLYSDHDQPLKSATRNEVVEVLNDLVQGKTCNTPWVGAIGCIIEP